LVREQIEIAAGKRLSIRQDDVKTLGWAMQCRVNAEDPWNHYMPSPGQIRRFRLPGGPYVRVDTYGYSGCQVPMRYDPMLAKLVVWGEDREACVLRFRRALQDFAISGVRSNIPLYQRILEDPDFIAGTYATDFMRRPLLRRETDSPEELLRDLAVAAAIAYAARNQAMQSVVPERMQSGWHRSSRQLPG
jgi:acetyl-CoA carboxylase biotin carboxylase subunit